MSLLAVSDLSVRYDRPGASVQSVNGLGFELESSQTLGIVGESGSGKSQTALAIMGLLASEARISGSIRFEGKELLDLPRKQLDRIRGTRIGIVFQDPMSSLNPYRRIGSQMAEVLVHHRGVTKVAALAESARMLDAVGIADAARRLRQYPHEFSGGMCQRVTIAMALLGQPQLLIADEPTTALDVTVQAQVLQLLAGLKASMNLALILITHDFGVVAESCERCLVMYAGRVVEEGSTDAVLANPVHPYTQGLLASRPRLDRSRPSRLAAIPGSPPNPAALPTGCAFVPRCSKRLPVCERERPVLSVRPGLGACACHLSPAASVLPVV